MSDSIQIGKGLGPNFAAEPIRCIIGIVGDVRDAALNAEPRPTMYVPIADEELLEPRSADVHVAGDFHRQVGQFSALTFRPPVASRVQAKPGNAM